jgi:TPR repeat protein
MYHHGYGVEVDFRIARELYDEAATVDREYAYKVGMVYHCDGELQDISKAVKCYEKAGSDSAAKELGILFLYGTGVEKVFKKAIECFKKPGHIPVKSFYLGKAYYNGPDGFQDYNKAFQLFQSVKEWYWRQHSQSWSIFARYKNNPESSTTKEKYSFTMEPIGVFQGVAC